LERQTYHCSARLATFHLGSAHRILANAAASGDNGDAISGA